MTEQLSQFVLFGNFSSVNFDSLSKLADLKSKYGFITNATNDIIMPSQNMDNQGQIVVPQSFIPNMRPVFQTEDKKTSVFFGSSRIHIERRDYESEGYNTFNNMAIDIVNSLMKIELKFIRIALNGQIQLFDKKFMDELYQRLFNRSDLYNSNSDEWQLRIVSKENDETLMCGINKIISYNRTNILGGVSTEKRDLLQIGYDFNTFYGIDKVFSIDEINYFNKQATEYRKLVISGE